MTTMLCSGLDAHEDVCWRPWFS